MGSKKVLEEGTNLTVYPYEQVHVFSERNDPTGFLAARPRSLAPETNFDNFDEANYHTFIYGSSTTAWQDHGFDGNGGSGSFTGEGDQSGSGQDGGGDGSRKSNQEDNGNGQGSNNSVKVYIEKDGIGHVYIEINGTVFSYGRYNGSYSPSSGALGPVGDGILLKKTGEDAQAFIDDRTSQFPTSVYVINNVNANAVYDFYQNAYNNGAVNLDGGRFIDTYFLLGNNCATGVCRGLQEGGSSIPIFQTPAGLNRFLLDVQRIETGWNPGALVPWEPKY